MKSEEVKMFFEDMGYFPYFFGCIGWMINTTLGYLGSFPLYFPKPSKTRIISQLILTLFFILIVYAAYPYLKEKIPAIETTAFQIGICIGIGFGGVPAFKLVWMMFCAVFKVRTGIDPNDYIKKGNKPTNGQTS